MKDQQKNKELNCRDFWEMKKWRIRKIKEKSQLEGKIGKHFKEKRNAEVKKGKRKRMQ